MIRGLMDAWEAGVAVIEWSLVLDDKSFLEN